MGLVTITIWQSSYCILGQL